MGAGSVWPPDRFGEHRTWLVAIHIAQEGPEQGRIRVGWVSAPTDSTATGDPPLAVWCDDCGNVVSLALPASHGQVGTTDFDYQRAHSVAVLGQLRRQAQEHRRNDQAAADVRGERLIARRNAG
ncbi:MAG: hypothetical protein U0R80_14685 [Nocardioidaceae bacterium]